jgi:hypothetical protein
MHMHKKRLYLLIGVCIAFVIGILTLALFTANRQAQNEQANNQPRVEYQGNLACLPHKNAQSGQPQTLECAIGLHATDGSYYALKDVSEEYQYIEFSTDIVVLGDISEPAANDKYDTKGTIKVRAIEILSATD